MVKEVLSVRHVKRVKVKQLLKEGFSDLQVARKVDCSRETVRRQRKRFSENPHQETPEIVLSASRCGRPRKVDEPVEKKIRSLAYNKRGASTAETAKNLSIL